MVYITGDTHGDFSRYFDFVDKISPTEDDVIIVLGDAGLNYHRNEADDSRKEFVNQFPFTTFCIHGNHEMRPGDIQSYQTKEFHGGIVWYEETYPNIAFAKDGEIYDFDCHSCIVIGGAYSLDKYERLELGMNWFANEQPSDEIKSFVEKQLIERGNEIDIILSHTCPLKYEPVEVFRPGVDQSQVDKSTEIWLDKIENRVKYNKWYCGHYHTAKKIDKIQFMFKDIDVLSN